MKSDEPDLLLAKKKGRPSTGIETSVLYRRVPSDKKEVLASIVDEACKDIQAWVGLLENKKPFPVGMGGQGKQAEYGVQVPVDVKALLGDVERLTAEVEGLKVRLEKCARTTDDRKAIYWIHQYDELKAKVGNKGEYDQT